MTTFIQKYLIQISNGLEFWCVLAFFVYVGACCASMDADDNLRAKKRILWAIFHFALFWLIPSDEALTALTTP